MALTSAVKRGTGMPGSDQLENTDVLRKLTAGWIVGTPAIGSNATAASYGTFIAVVNGVMNVVTTNTIAMTGTIAASTTGAYVYFIAQAGTIRTAVHTAGTTVAAIVLAQASANSEIPFAITKVACTATAFNGGTNSLADSSYTVTHMNLTGPTGIAISTQLYTVVPG
jgi:hypothetical protein